MMYRSQAQHTPGVLSVGNKRTETLSFDHAKPPPPKGRMVSSIGSIEDHAKLWKLVFLSRIHYDLLGFAAESRGI